jgi:PAS domain S-box-containing protein
MNTRANGKINKTNKSSLKDSEIHYRRLFEAAQDGILILDAETGMIIDVNPFMVTMLGYSREEFIEKKLWEMGAFKDVKASIKAFEDLQNKEYIRYENLPLKTKNGQMIEVEFISHVYLVEGNKVIQCNIRDNTEHTRLILALRENEQKYFNLIKQSSDGIFIIDLAGNILTANDAIIRELGFTEQEFLAMNIWDIIPPHHLKQYRERLSKILAGERFEEYGHYEVRDKDGRHHSVEILSTPHYNGKNIIGFQGIARDVTARKQAEKALQESEERNRSLIEHLPTVVYTNAVGNAGATLYVSPQIQTLLGYTPEEWLADSNLWVKALHPEDRQHVLAQVAATDESKEPFEMDYRMIARDGHLVWVHDQIVLKNDAKGQGQLWQGIMLDITERKQAENELYESEERFKNSFQYSAIGMALVSLEGKWLKVNPMLCSIVGYSEKELLTKTFQDITHPDDLHNDLNNLSQILDGKIKSYKMEKRYFHKEGNIIWVLLVVALARDSSGAPLYLISQIEDITEHKQADEKVRYASEFLQSVQDALSAHIAILDEQGNIIQVNAAWRDFGNQNGLSHSNHCIGMNYIDVCDSAKGDYANEASPVANAIRAVQAGEQNEIWVEYPCDAAHEKRWFVARITNFEHNGHKWIVVAHENITERKQVEETLRQSLQRNARANKTLQTLSLAAQTAQRARTPQDIYKTVGDAIKNLGFHLVICDVNLEKREISLAFANQSPKLMRAAEKLVGLSFKTYRIPLIAGGFYNQVLLANTAQIFYDVEAVVEQSLPPLLRFLTKQVVSLIGIKQGIYASLKVDGKPQRIMIISGGDLAEVDLPTMNILAAQISIALENATLFDNLHTSHTELTKAYDETIEGWSHALDLRDKETEGHSQRVTDLTVRLAQHMGINSEELVHVRRGALLHDIGKMGVPDHILLKPGKLTEDEWEIMKKHPFFSYLLLAPIAYLKPALDIPYCHHEKWDGTGYPRGLIGEQIPLVARIFAVVDVWDALRSDRPYREAWPEEKVREHILSLSGTHFDPQVVDKFMQIPKEAFATMVNIIRKVVV